MNKQAWSILTEEEKVSLSLAHGHGKSTWQAGEIMNKAHYKYIEIKRRAEFFLRTFTEYYEQYPVFWPDKHTFPEAFKEFIQLSLIDRLPLKDVLSRVSSSGYQIASYRNRQIQAILLEMRASKSPHVIDLYELILEFDRWNNFRILPPKCQMPSAFERRNKTRELKYIRRLSRLPNFTIAKMREKFEYNGIHAKYHVVIISKFFESRYIIMPIRKVDKSMDEMSRLGLFVFKDEDNANRFARLVAEYLFKLTPKKANYGQRFWPEYRTLAKSASNYKDIYQIITTKSTLETAYIDMDLLKVRKKDKVEAMAGAKKVSEVEIKNLF